LCARQRAQPGGAHGMPCRLLCAWKQSGLVCMGRHIREELATLCLDDLLKVSESAAVAISRLWTSSAGSDHRTLDIRSRILRLFSPGFCAGKPS
jgi:hypothetical protein